MTTTESMLPAGFPKNPRHEKLRADVAAHLATKPGEDYALAPDTILKLIDEAEGGRLLLFTVSEATQAAAKIMADAVTAAGTLHHQIKKTLLRDVPIQVGDRVVFDCEDEDEDFWCEGIVIGREDEVLLVRPDETDDREPHTIRVPEAEATRILEPMPD